MLKLARARPSDVFYDLGCGWGQNLIIALAEFGVRKAVGIERDRERHARASSRLGKWGLEGLGFAVLGDFERLLKGSLDEADLSEATVVFYGLSTDTNLLKSIEKLAKKRSRLVYYYSCLFPEIMPDTVDFPFYVSVAPFRRTKSEYSWLASVVQKRKSFFGKARKPDAKELWDELEHDYDVNENWEDVADYKRRLRKVVG